MKVSIWRQDRKGARWYRVGVIVVEGGGRLPFRTNIPHGAAQLRPIWPRWCWYSMERLEFNLLSRERRE